MKTATTLCLTALLALTWACKSKDEGKSEGKSEGETAAGEATAAGNEAGQGAAAADPGGEVVEKKAASASVDGYVSFEVNGEKKRFEYLPGENNMVSSMLTSVQANADASSDEFFSVMLTHFDARKAEYPSELEVSIRFDPKKHKSQADVIKSPKPMVVYSSPEGVRYGGYNKVTVKSFEGGVLKGTAADIELHPQRGEGDGPLKFTSIEFEARLDAPIPGTIDEAMGKTLE